MNTKFIIIFLLIIILIIISSKEEKFTNLPKGPDLQCDGLYTSPGMSCGYMKEGNSMCLPDEDDCFTENNIQKCYCKMQEIM